MIKDNIYILNKFFILNKKEILFNNLYFYSKYVKNYLIYIIDEYF